MKAGIAVLVVLLLTGCATRVPTYTGSNRVRTKWEPLIEGSDIATDTKYKYYPSEMLLSNGMLLRGNTWNGFLKGFIESLPVEKRDDVLKGLTRFYKEYDKVDKVIKFEPLRYISGPYTWHSYVSLKGQIKVGKVDAFVKIQYYGSSWIFAESIKVVADDFTWQSPKLNFYKDNYTEVWEYTYLDLSEPSVRELVNNIINSQETIIRFQGRQYYSDLVVTERMKIDLKAMIKAIDTINKMR